MTSSFTKGLGSPELWNVNAAVSSMQIWPPCSPSVLVCMSKAFPSLVVSLLVPDADCTSSLLAVK